MEGTNIAPCEGCGVSGFGVRDALCDRCRRVRARGEFTPFEWKARTKAARDAMSPAERRTLARVRVDNPKRAAAMIETKLVEIEHPTARKRGEGTVAAVAEAVPVAAAALDAVGAGASTDEARGHDLFEDGDPDSDEIDLDGALLEGDGHAGGDAGAAAFADGKESDDGDDAKNPYLQHLSQRGDGGSTMKKEAKSKGGGQASIAAARRLAAVRAKLSLARSHNRDTVRAEERRIADPETEARRVAQLRAEAAESRGSGGGRTGAPGTASSADVGVTAYDVSVAGAKKAAASRRDESGDPVFKAYSRESRQIARAQGAGAVVDPTALYQRLNAEASASVAGNSTASLAGPGAPKTRSEAIASLTALAVSRRRAAERHEARRKRVGERKPKGNDHVNNRNAQFNAQLEKDYGAATKEVRDALERGTAL